jgi:hypothetical protein
MVGEEQSMKRSKIIDRLALRMGYVPVSEAMKTMENTVNDNSRLREENSHVKAREMAQIMAIETLRKELHELHSLRGAHDAANKP